MEKIRKVSGALNASGAKFAVVVGRWNSLIGERLLAGALETLTQLGSDQEITIVHVPGSFEIPLAARELALTKKFDAVICLGALIEGETDHYQLIAGELTSGIGSAMRETGVPITFGVVTAHNMEQALARAGCKAGNKGSEAASAAVEMVNVLADVRKLRGLTGVNEVKGVKHGS